MSGTNKRTKKIRSILPNTPTEISTVNQAIILHLSCFLADLIEIEPEIIDEPEPEPANIIDATATSNDNDQNITKNINNKLKHMTYCMSNNIIEPGRQSACFWCTCDFDNNPIYIPKWITEDKCECYGHFCSPECSLAYLMKERIDMSVKYTRIELLNNIYGKIYNYTKSIKPAPDPRYVLDKFLGSLNIQEFRALFENDRLFYVMDKPMTRIMPEFHDDNSENNIFNAKKSSNKKNRKSKDKNTIVNEKFKLAV